ncbi:uncharacterized protein LOC141612991 [Silene latifolia]|uniref:uncharacterized protein LOC141612991 n=1 Tax=Silene latifolia TaxID=37657 RepID=UPI003D7815A5
MNTARAFDVIDHIEPPMDAVIEKDAQWTRLDAIVKQWIYSTISLDLLHTILEPGATAQAAWNRLKDIFVDNQHSRAVLLEQQFSSIHMDNYNDVSSYCQALKMIADQLANVGAPVSDTRLVLQMVTKVSDGYDGIASIIQQRDPLPSFYKARSMLALEEKRRSNVSGSTATALHASQSNSPDSDSRPNSNTKDGSNSNKGKGGRNNRKNNNRGKQGRGGSTSNQQSSGGNNGGRGNQQQPGTWTWVPLSPWQAPQQQGWTVPPCRYPTAGWTPPPPSRSQGILGPQPNQAFIAQPGTMGAAQGTFVPTDIAAVMQSLALQQPDDAYYMDTGASSHMTSNNGTLSSYSKSGSNRHIIVGNGQLIPIVGRGSQDGDADHEK